MRLFSPNDPPALKPNLRKLCSLRFFPVFGLAVLNTLRPRNRRDPKLKRCMHSAVRLLAPVFFGLMMLNIPLSAAFKIPPSQPAFTPGTNQANLSNQITPAPSPDPRRPVSSAAPSSPSTPDRETIVRLKIFLDQHSFGPGEIDDHWTDLCASALRLYQTANAGNATGEIGPELKQQLSDITPLYIGYQLRPEDLAWVGKAPH